MSQENQNINIPEVEDTTSQPTEKLSRVTEEMLENFSSKKSKKEDIENQSNFENNDNQEINDAASVADNTDEAEQKDENTKKTVVDFSEDFETGPQKRDNVNNNKRKSNHFLKIIIVVFILCICGCFIFGIWNRWFRYNDELDIISNWQISETDKIVQIEQKTITINSSTIMKYQLDTFSKTINFEVGDMKGTSHYRFSWDRNQLAFIENCAPDPIATMFSDIGYFWDWATCNMSNIDLSPAYTNNNKQDVDTENTGLDDIMNNGHSNSILLDKISTKKPEDF